MFVLTLLGVRNKYVWSYSDIYYWFAILSIIYTLLIIKN